MRLRNQYDITYMVNEKAKTVTAVVEPIRFDKKLYDLCGVYGTATGKYSPIPDHFVGVARFKDGDSYDVEMGKKIARAKALRQANKIMGNYMNDMLIAIQQYTSEMTDLAYGTRVKAAEYNDDIAALTARI